MDCIKNVIELFKKSKADITEIKKEATAKVIIKGKVFELSNKDLFNIHALTLCKDENKLIFDETIFTMYPARNLDILVAILDYFKIEYNNNVLELAKSKNCVVVEGKVVHESGIYRRQGSC